MSDTPKPWGGKRGSVVTVGTFDGVHLGHWAVLHEIAARARRDNRRSLLVTFEPHPLEIVNPQAAPQLLTVGDERLEILAQGELDLIVFLPFTKTLSQYSPEAFVRLLIDRFQMEELVIGHDHGFGRGRSGDGRDRTGRTPGGRALEVGPHRRDRDARRRYSSTFRLTHSDRSSRPNGSTLGMRLPVG